MSRGIEMAKQAAESKTAAVAYYRVSTKEQGSSGLGLAAQKRSVEAFVQARGFRLVGDFKDVESGKHNQRPGLNAALELCKETGATLIVAKLDRLSRNAAFILTLRDSEVPFVAVDMPEANTMTVGIMSILAQQEREMISSRTRAALAELKANGKRLGAKSGEDRFGDAGRERAAERKHELAMERHNGEVHTVVALRSEGWTIERIAEHLRKSGLKTARGLEYNARAVRHLLKLAEVSK
jgi:DNA invertase Pin-like site-specific DNA recombinase